MRTKEACATRLTVIIAMIVSAAIAVWLPAAPAHALTVSVKVNINAAACNFGSATATTVTLNTTSCPNITITPQPGFSAAQAAALATSGSQNQVVIRNIVIKNTSGGFIQVVITATHSFSSTVVASPASRAYGIALNASFARKDPITNAALLATGNGIIKRGSYFYSCTGCADQIGGGAVGVGQDLTYAVPSTGSTSLNTIPTPAPSASESPRNCASFGKSCGPGETLQTILTVNLSKKNDTVTIPGGDHTAAGGCEKKADPNCDPAAFPNAVIAALSAAATLQQNTPNPVVNINDNGQLAVNLLCNLAFSCETIDQASLRFGPAGARPKSVQLKDINNDGVIDLKATFANQETGIACGDTMATLSGTNTFPGFGLLEFDAPVGFGTSPGCP
jgi:hypothetical protein